MLEFCYSTWKLISLSVDFIRSIAKAMAGVPIPVIKELLGHSDIATTMIYAHLSPDIHKAAVEKLPF